MVILLLVAIAGVAIAAIAHVITRRSVIQASLIASFTAGVLCVAMQAIESWPSAEMNWCILRMEFSLSALLELLLSLGIGAFVALIREATAEPLRPDPT